mgnify:CR=1 FL=1
MSSILLYIANAKLAISLYIRHYLENANGDKFSRPKGLQVLDICTGINYEYCY